MTFCEKSTDTEVNSFVTLKSNYSFNGRSVTQLLLVLTSFLFTSKQSFGIGANVKASFLKRVVSEGKKKSNFTHCSLFFLKEAQL